MALDSPNTDMLLDEAGAGNADARRQLIECYRDRLIKMVAVRLDRRLAARFDASDVVQEALMDADRRLDQYLRDRPVSYYPWLRRIAWERLVKHQRRHVAGRRSVAREAALPSISNDSLNTLAGRLAAPGSSPSQRASNREQIAKARSALMQMSERDREVLVLRYLEHLSTAEMAAVLEITPGAVNLRHLRAIERLRGLMVIGEEMI